MFIHRKYPTGRRATAVSPVRGSEGISRRAARGPTPARGPPPREPGLAPRAAPTPATRSSVTERRSRRRSRATRSRTRTHARASGHSLGGDCLWRSGYPTIHGLTHGLLASTECARRAKAGQTMKKAKPANSAENAASHRSAGRRRPGPSASLTTPIIATAASTGPTDRSRASEVYAVASVSSPVAPMQRPEPNGSSGRQTAEA